MPERTVDDILQKIAQGEFGMRAAHVTPKTIDKKERSIEAVFASEQRVATWDWQRGEMVDEILLASGFRFADQIPFLDSHDRFSIAGQIGSASDMKVETDKLTGRVFFGRTQKAEDAFTMATDGHIEDLSIGFVKKIVVFVERGATFQNGSTTIEGPANISLETEVKEVSLTPIGADSTTKLRGIGGGGAQDLDSMRRLIYNLENELGSARKAIALLTNTK